MKVMGTHFRRWLAALSLFVLISALSWHSILSFCIREAAFLRWGCNLSFNEMRIENGAIVLDEASLTGNPSYELFAKKASISLSLKGPISLHIIQPHFVLSEGIPAQFIKKGGTGRIALIVEDGTFEIGGSNPLSGNLSFREKTLHLEGGGGSLAMLSSGLEDEKRIECSFENWPLAPFSHLFNFLDIYPVDGHLSGFLHISMEKTIGRLILDDAGWISSAWDSAGGVNRLEIEGEADLGLSPWLFDLKQLRRLKVRLEGVSAVRKSSRIESLGGEFFFNEGVGFHWELDGKNFSWQGKSFFRHEGAEWLQSRLQIAKGASSLDMEKAGEGRIWTLALDQADNGFFQWISDFVPRVDWPCKLAGGKLQAKLSCMEQGGRILEWNATHIEGEDLELSFAEGDFSCRRLAAAAGCKENERSKFDGALMLDDGRLTIGEISIDDLHADLAITQGEIRKSLARALCNGLESTAAISGSLQEILADIRVRGSWADFGKLVGLELQGDDPVETSLSIKGDWETCSGQVCLPFSGDESLSATFLCKGIKVQEAEIVAKRFDFSRLRSTWGGVADLSLRYADAKWSTKALGDDLFFTWRNTLLWIPTLEMSGVYEEGRFAASAEKIEGEAAVMGEAIPFCASFSLDDRLLSVRIDKADVAGIDLAGEWLLSLEKEMPFAFEASRLQGDLTGVADLAGFSDLSGKIASSPASFSLAGSLLADPATWNWALSANLSEIREGRFQDAQAHISLDSKVGLLSLSDLRGSVEIGEAKFPFRGFAEVQESGWRFDLRLEDRFRDLARLTGSAEREESRISFHFDPDKSHLLGVGVQVQECRMGRDRLETLKLAAKVSLQDLSSWRRSLSAIDQRLGALLDAPLEGVSAVEVDLRANALSLVRIAGDELTWKGISLPFHLALLQSQEKWKIEELRIGDLTGEASFAKEEDGWRIEGGTLCVQEGAEAALSGFVSSDLQCEISIESLFLQLQQLDKSAEGEVRGKGSVTVEWRDDLRFETDLDLILSPFKFDAFAMENGGPLQLHFSKRQGLLVRGLDLQVQKPEPLYGRIGLMQYDFAERRWHLHHAHLRLPTDSFALILQKLDPRHPLAGLLASLDPKNDLECFAEIAFAEDFSNFSCCMKEGFIPFWGEVRHLQNVDVRCSGNKASVDFLALHQGHSFKVGSVIELDRQSGMLTIEDAGMPLEEGERAMALQWEVDPNKGLLIHSIEGSFGGIEASFHEELCEEGTSLVGSAKLDCGYLSELFSPRIGRVFNELKMGRGYELKGRLFYGPGWQQAHFKGLLSGKNCELCGWQIRSLHSQIEIGPSLVRLFELKGSDAAGILKIDQLSMSQAESEPWKIAMPSFKLLEFRPSLLQRIGREVGPVGPLVIRELRMLDFQGELEESLTYTANGFLSFINSFKREHTVFDLPADVLGRIFGLDLELLIPVKGTLSFALKEGKFWLDDLKDAYSEGKRSKFFLVKEDASPTIDLDGNVNILVTMKQYVLFKFTENFLLSIDGTLENLSYSLQKKSRIQKLFEKSTAAD